MLLRALCSLVVSLFTAPQMAAQGPPSSALQAVAIAPPVQATFALEPYIVQQATLVYAYRADGTGYRERTIAIKIQSDAALRTFGVVNIPFASASERVEIRYARARHPNGTVTETPLTAALEEPAPVTREAPFYSDLKQKELPVTGLRSGDILEWQARIVRTVAEAPNQFWGQEAFITEGIALSEDIELHLPASAHATVWTNPTAGSTPTDVTTNGERVLHWHHLNLKPTVGPEADAAKKAAETHVLTPAEETDATDGKLPSLAFTTFADWAAVGAWYRSLSAPRALPDVSIKAKAAELTAGLTTDDARAHAIYTYVATQIRYIGVAFGIGRYQPHSAADVLSNQYGDCKDKHTLVSALLAAVNIPSDAVLIGAGIRFNPDVPAPQSFNHLITRAHINGHPVWLDTTAEIAPWRVLFPTLRDKSALVIPPSAPAIILRSDPDLPFAATETWEASGSLDADGNSDSHIKLVLHGDTELVFRAVLHQLSPAQYAEFLDQFLRSMGYAGTGTHLETTRPDDTSTPLTLSFDYHREKGGDWANLRILPQLEPLGLPYVDDVKPPISTILLGGLRTATATAQMKLPLNWTAELPEAIHARSPFATIDTTFHLKNSVLYAERRLVVLQTKVPAAEWKAYKKFQDAAGLATEPYIQLIRLGASSPSVGGSTRDSNAEAATLIQQANAAIQSAQPDRALELLDNAKALNPEQRGLWGTYGFRAYGLGISSEAVDDYRKEVEFHPDATWVYSPLAEELSRSGRMDEALAACRKGIAAEPASARVNGLYVVLLMRQGRTAEAATAGAAALKLVPPDDVLRPQLALTTAQAQVRVGQNADAAAVLTELLKSTDNSGIKNDAAYSLAGIGLDLPTAEAASRSSLESLGAETRAWTLDESPATLKQKSSLLAAAWDTFGYILLREGKLPEARSYIEASWRSRQSAEVGLHLGDIQLAQGDPSAALATFQLAQATLPGSQTFRNGKIVTSIVNPDAKPIADKLDADIAAAKKAGGKSTIKDSRAELQKLRTLDLGRDGSYAGSVEYRLLLSQGKVELVRALGKGALPNAEAFLRAAPAFAHLTPATSDAKIVLTGYINCLATTCEFVLEL